MDNKNYAIPFPKEVSCAECRTSQMFQTGNEFIEAGWIWTSDITDEVVAVCGSTECQEHGYILGDGSMYDMRPSIRRWHKYVYGGNFIYSIKELDTYYRPVGFEYHGTREHIFPKCDCGKDAYVVFSDRSQLSSFCEDHGMFAYLKAGLEEGISR